jgi:hypothetical protein
MVNVEYVNGGQESLYLIEPLFNTTVEPISQHSLAEVLSDLDKETEIKDTTLFPGQKINGYVVLRLIHYIINRSY